MDQAVTASFDKPAYNPVLFISYKVVRKILKYSSYITSLYFAYKGLIAWK